MTIEELVINYLLESNVSTDVYAEVPLDPPDKYVLVQRSSGNYQNEIRHIGLYTEVRCRTSKLEAAQLHEDVVAAMRSMRDSAPVFRSELVSDYDAAMTSTKEYRFQALWEITL